MIGRLTFIAALLAAPLAMAQEPESSTPGQIAEAHAYADRLIADGEAGAYFANKTDSATPEVLHLPSGMPCLFNMAEGERIAVLPQGASNIPRGDDVGCVIVDGANGAQTTTYATRWHPLPDEALLMEQTTAAIRQRWPSARTYDGQVAAASLENVSPPRTAVYLVDLPQGLYVTIAMVSNLGEWSYKLRFTAPHEAGEVVGLEAAIMMAHMQMMVTAD